MNFQGKAFSKSNWKRNSDWNSKSSVINPIYISYFMKIHASSWILGALYPFSMLVYLPVFTSQLKAIKSNSSSVSFNKLFHFFQLFLMRYFTFKFNWIFKPCHKIHPKRTCINNFYFILFFYFTGMYQSLFNSSPYSIINW